MEALLSNSHAKPTNPAGCISSSYEDQDMEFMLKPYLDYINQMLMEEGIDDMTCSMEQQELQDSQSYQAMLNSFYEIIGGELSLPDSCAFADTQLRPHLINISDEDSPDEQNINDGMFIDNVRILDTNQIPAPPTFTGNFYDSCHEDSTVKLPDKELSLEDVKVKADYTALYVGEQHSCPDNASVRNGKGRKVAGKGTKSEKGKVPGEETYVDLKEVLVMCAQAVSIGDVRRANEILRELHQVHGASPYGSGLQRTAHYFSEALVARMSSAGSQHFRAISNNTPSFAPLLMASKKLFEVCPNMKLLHYFANQSILKAAEGALRLHIVDYGLLYGMQWPCLINALADRKGGPPLLVITGIEFPQTGPNLALRLEESGRRLAEYARQYNVPFEYHSVIASKWEEVEPASLHLQQDEILVVNCIKRLRQVPDMGVDFPSPREKLLARMRSLKPHLLITGIVNAAYNSPFFVSRFREVLYYFTSSFDMAETMWGESPYRLTMERSLLYPDILNVVACEGAERRERPETYKQWQARIQRAGFEQLPVLPMVMSRSRSLVKQQYHKDFMVHDDGNGWMLLGWRGRILLAVSAWKPSTA